MTDKPTFGSPDAECLPLTRCICGATFPLWDKSIGPYPDLATKMPCCGRRLYFSQEITIHEVTDE